MDASVVKAWSNAGITCDTNWSEYKRNKYFLGDKEISRKDAFRHTMKVRGWNDVAIDYFEFDDYTEDF